MLGHAGDCAMTTMVGAVKCVTSTVHFFKENEFYWLIRNDIDELCVSAEHDSFGVTDDLTSFHFPYLYTFTMKDNL